MDSKQTTLPSDSKTMWWYWKSNKNPWSSSEPEEWTPYNHVENEIIEEAYLKKQGEAILDNYKLIFKTMIQVHKVYPDRQRLIKRVESKADKSLRNERFFASPSEQVAFDQSCHDVYPPIIAKWRETQKDIEIRKLKVFDYTGRVYYPHVKTIEQVVEGAAKGIIAEGEAQGFKIIAERMATKLRNAISSSNDLELLHCLIFLFTAETFLYKAVNKAFQKKDLEKVNTLGAFSYLLNEFVSKLSQVTQDFQYREKVYKGAKLSPETIAEYEKVKHFSWPSFVSGTKNQNIAQASGNVLFIIGMGSMGAVADFSRMSAYPNEEEVILAPNSVFSVEKIEKGDLTKIYLKKWD